jgi:hypothetical protein
MDRNTQLDTWVLTNCRYRNYIRKEVQMKEWNIRDVWNIDGKRRSRKNIKKTKEEEENIQHK